LRWAKASKATPGRVFHRKSPLIAVLVLLLLRCFSAAFCRASLVYAPPNGKKITHLAFAQFCDLTAWDASG
jgi:hypothetical protein